MGEPPAAVGLLHEALEAVISAQGIAAGRDELQQFVELGARERGIRRGADDLGVELRGIDGAGAGERHDVLGKHVAGAGAEALGVALAGHDRVIGGLSLEIFEAVAGDEDGLAGLVEAVIGAADALEQAGRALGRAHLDDAVDIAPVDAEIEAGLWRQGRAVARPPSPPRPCGAPRG